LRKVADRVVVFAFVAVSYAPIVEGKRNIVLGIASTIDDGGARADGSLSVCLNIGAVGARVVARGDRARKKHRGKDWRRAHHSVSKTC